MAKQYEIYVPRPGEEDRELINTHPDLGDFPGYYVSSFGCILSAPNQQLKNTCIVLQPEIAKKTGTSVSAAMARRTISASIL